MKNGIHVDLFIVRDDGREMTPELHEKILRKAIALFTRLGCTGHGTWRLGPPPDVEDLLG